MDKEFNEDCAISYIRNNAVTSRKYDGDDILNVIDIIWDYYEDHGMLSLDFGEDGPDDDTLDRGDLVAHVSKMLAKDKGNRVAQQDVAPIVDAELAYEAWLEQP